MGNEIFTQIQISVKYLWLFRCNDCQTSLHQEFKFIITNNKINQHIPPIMINGEGHHANCISTKKKKKKKDQNNWPYS